MDIPVKNKIESFFAQFQKKNYRRGELLVHADHDPAGIFYLSSGVVKQYSISKKGDEVVVNVFKPISFFPMSWALNATANEYYFEAVSDAEVFIAPKEIVIDFLKKEPSVMFDLMSRVFRGTDGLLTRLSYLMSADAYDRLVTELVIEAKRFGKKMGDSEGIEIIISEKELAAQTGLTRETVSRVIKKLKLRDVVELGKNKLVIKSLDKLTKEL